MTLKLKLSILGALAALLAALSIAAALMASQYEQDQNEANETRYYSYIIADEFRQLSMDLTRLCRTYVSTGDQKYWDAYWDIVKWSNGETPRPDYVHKDLYRGEKKKQLDIMKELGFSAKEFALLEEAGKKSDALIATEDQAMKSIKAGQVVDGPYKSNGSETPEQFALRIVFDAKYHDEVDKIIMPVNQFFTELDARTENMVASARSKASMWMNASLTLQGFVFIILIGVVVYVIRGILKPISEFSRLLESVADGDLTQSYNDTRKDEVGQMGRSLQVMIDKLSDIISSNASGSQSLAEGASEQAASLEETSASLEELSSMAARNADSAGSASGLANETSQVVATANNSMAQLRSAMDRINAASDEMAKIIRTIDEIAFQTNLLALNAAVEAARAGEAGAGFAVVADEVRNLAMRAAEAAQNTGQLIEGNISNIKDGTELVVSTDDAFNEVVASVDKIKGIINEISSASSEQTQGINQITQTMSQMDKVTQQNAANAEELAASMNIFRIRDDAGYSAPVAGTKLLTG